MLDAGERRTVGLPGPNRLELPQAQKAHACPQRLAGKGGPLRCGRMGRGRRRHRPEGAPAPRRRDDGGDLRGRCSSSTRCRAYEWMRAPTAWRRWLAIVRWSLCRSSGTTVDRAERPCRGLSLTDGDAGCRAVRDALECGAWPMCGLQPQSRAPARRRTATFGLDARDDRRATRYCRPPAPQHVLPLAGATVHCCDARSACVVSQGKSLEAQAFCSD